MHVYTQILELSWEVCSINACSSLSLPLTLSLSLSLSLLPRLLQHKFFIRANKIEVRPKTSEQSSASSSKEGESSTLRKRGEKPTDSPRAKKVNKKQLPFTIIVAMSCRPFTTFMHKSQCANCRLSQHCTILYLQMIVTLRYTAAMWMWQDELGKMLNWLQLISFISSHHDPRYAVNIYIPFTTRACIAYTWQLQPFQNQCVQLNFWQAVNLPKYCQIMSLCVCVCVCVCVCLCVVAMADKAKG